MCLPKEEHWEHLRIKQATRENQLRLEKKKSINKEIGRKALDDLKTKIKG